MTDVAKITLDWFAAAEDALAAESVAISKESPKWNVQGRGHNGENTGTGIMVESLDIPEDGRTAGARPRHSIRDVPRRIEQIQILYNNRSLVLKPKYGQKGSKSEGKRKGFTVRPGTLGPLRDALNACVKGEKKIENTLTISRWLEDGAPGLKLRPEDEV